MSMKYIVSFGGGLTSYEALRRTLDRHGHSNTVAVFADVGSIRDSLGRTVCGEDDDLHRFMGDIENLLSITIHRLKNPRYTDIWDVFFKRRFLGNTQHDPCSELMKRDVISNFVNARFTSDYEQQDAFHEPATLVVGMDWTEKDRAEDYRRAAQPWRTWLPLCEAPFLTKQDIAASLAVEGIEVPDLYEEGFPHNNCGGFCCKMGHEQAWRLWKNRPHVYAFHEGKEQDFRATINPDVAFLRDRRGGETRGMPLKDLRERFESGYRPARLPGEGCGGACMTPASGPLIKPAEHLPAPTT